MWYSREPDSSSEEEGSEGSGHPATMLGENTWHTLPNTHIYLFLIRCKQNFSCLLKFLSWGGIKFPRMFYLPPPIIIHWSSLFSLIQSGWFWVGSVTGGPAGEENNLFVCRRKCRI